MTREDASVLAEKRDEGKDLTPDETSKLKMFETVKAQYLEEHKKLKNNVGAPCLPAKDPTSLGPDVILPVNLSGPSGEKTENGDIVKLMLAAKTLSKKGLGFAAIRAEVENSFKYKAFDDGATEAFRSPAVLVIIATRVNKEVSAWLDKGCENSTCSGSVANASPSNRKWRVLGRGVSHNFSSSKGKRGVGKKGKEIEKLIPPGCQVVVLNEEATKYLITETVRDYTISSPR
jgi:hypothetical protein